MTRKVFTVLASPFKILIPPYISFSSLLRPRTLKSGLALSTAPLLNFFIITLLFSSQFFSTQTSQTKKVSKEQGVSFHLSPFPSLFHSSRQCSCSPFSYWKLFGSPAFQFSYVIGFPVDIQKNLKGKRTVNLCNFSNTNFIHISFLIN